eukprot:TRINITY_DN6612_c0_g2_i1.p1 TRINITY_DN6612_c0_g2~~TRINITY_DN6612_c0_g2_i1.p1  ORF type:complete len:302 (+),score=74.35 TRINITY_DN6612_c0_g2_i1:163-1068(+)
MSGKEVVVGVYQGLSELGDLEANTKTIETIAKNASASNGVQILLFPEMFLSGYEIGRAHIHRLSQVTHSSPYIKRIAAAARSNRIAICVGYPEKILCDKEPSGWVFHNSAILFDESGQQVLNYRKTHLWKVYEDKVFTPGNALETAVLRIKSSGAQIRVGILICYDVEFPESAKLLHVQNAELILIPTALDNAVANEVIPNCTVPTRALENNCFIMYSNFAGVERSAVAQERFKLKKEVVYCGRSAIVSPFGVDLARASPEANAEVLVGRLEWKTRSDAITRNPYLVDRRPDMYSPLKASL